MIFDGDFDMKNKWLTEFKRKFKVVIVHPETLEEKNGFSMSKMKFWTLILIGALIIITLTTCVIFFTRVRELIPGYTDVTLDRRVYDMERRADSLGMVFHQNDIYIENLKRIINEEDYDDGDFMTHSGNNKNTMAFYVPMKGLVTNHFNGKNKHYGVDVVAQTDAVIKATADGTVIFSDWSVESGNVIVIQHDKRLVSVYKHNASLMKHVGDVVKAGDVVAIVGGGGSTSTGPHLHFELWFKGNPVNPEELISFEGK